jgi:hypothetical protein
VRPSSVIHRNTNPGSFRNSDKEEEEGGEKIEEKGKGKRADHELQLAGWTSRSVSGAAGTRRSPKCLLAAAFDRSSVAFADSSQAKRMSGQDRTMNVSINGHVRWLVFPTWPWHLLPQRPKNQYDE